MPNTIDSQDPITQKEQSIINVLTRGSTISPISLETLQNHLQEVDPHAWQIIWREFIQGSQEDIARIFSYIRETPGVQFPVPSLVEMLLSLPKGNDLENKLLQLQ